MPKQEDDSFQQHSEQESRRKTQDDQSLGEATLAALKVILPESGEIKERSKLIYSFDEVSDEVLSRIGGKAANLVLLRKAGLPVPAGYAIPTEVHDFYLEKGTLPEGLVSEIVRIKHELGGKVAIRSSANCEDGTELSMAGVFQSQYVDDDEQVTQVVEQIFLQARSEEVAQFLALHRKSLAEVKMGIVVQELIKPETSGVIYTDINGNEILVQYVNGFGAKLVDGETQGSTLLINEHGKIVQSAGFEMRPLSPDVISQIQTHTETISSLFPHFPQDIEFACKNGLVSILQARTLTADLDKVDLRETLEDTLEAAKHKLRQLVAEEKQELGTQTAIFSDANYSELLPRPTEMDIGIHMYVWGGSDGVPGAKQLGHAAMGYQVGDEAIGIIKFIGGRTYFSIARNAGVYHIGFPTATQEYFSTLVNEYLATVQADPERGAYPQMGLYLQDPTLEDLQLRFGDKANDYFAVYQAFSSEMRKFAEKYLVEFQTQRLPEATHFIEKLQSIDIQGMTGEQLVNHALMILEHNRTQSYVDFVRGARLGFYYSQRLQNLLQQTLKMNKDEAQRIYSRLNQGLEGSAITEANLAIAAAPSEEEAISIAQELIGHYSSGEMLEIRHLPMRDDPERLLAYVRGIRQTGQYQTTFEQQRQIRLVTQEEVLSKVPQEAQEELAQVMHSSQTYMAVRETAKYYFTKEYLYLHDTLELLGKQLGLAQGDIYFLYPRELPQFATDPSSMLHIINARKQTFENSAQLNMPPIIRESDIESLGFKQKETEAFTTAVGKFLADGPQITGVIVNADEFITLANVNTVMQQYQEQNIPIILAASQMNLSHDPLISQSTGLIIRNAGLVAHGAQRARELGKGAIGGINTDLLKTGTRVIFNPETRTVTATISESL